MPEPREDPIVTSSRREALVFLVIWTSALTYTVGYCYTHGYGRKLDASLDGMTFYFGWPDWVFWGVMLPWCVCTAVSIVFALWFMQDVPLGPEADENDDDGDALS